MTMLVETPHDAGYLVSEANKTRSRAPAILLSGQNLGAGTVLGRKLVGASAAAAAFAGNTGAGAMGAITVSGEAKLGNYKLTILHPVSGAGAFRVDGPDGIEVGTGQVGTAFSAGGLAFTLADGTPDFVAGDGFDITVSGGTEKYAIMDPAATDGTGHAAGILYGDTDASAADTACTITARQAEVNSAELVWKSGITDPQKTAALAELAALGIIAR